MARAEALQNHLRLLIAAKNISDPLERAAALKSYYFPNTNARYDRAFIGVNWVLAAISLGVVIAKYENQSASLSAAPLAFTAAFFVADLMSAVFHKWLDSFACEQNSLWGSSARSFRVHHEFPNNLNETTYVHNVSAFATFSTFLYALLFTGLLLGAGPNLSLMLWVMLLLFTNGTEIHKQAHRLRPGWFFRVGQRSGFFLRRKNHLRHHRDELNSDYGIINGWSNGLAASIGLWRKMDLAAWRYFGVLPRNWIQAPKSVPAELVEQAARGEKAWPREFAVYREAFPMRPGTELADQFSTSR